MAASQKQILGQFFTKNDFWLKDHILAFIRSTGAEVAYDPFAGGGDLLEVAKRIGFKKTKGLDIDPTLPWKTNDSLVSIPKVKNSIIITNPPYLSNYSARRKGVYSSVRPYFETCRYDDLYQLAIEKALTNEFGIMIVPETFINSCFPKNRLVSITIIEEELFDDTDTPVCVICFDGREKPLSEVMVYKQDKKLGSLGSFEKMRRVPRRTISIKFNVPSGKIALRAIDATSADRPISFMHTREMDYPIADIKVSSRLITVIDIKTPLRIDHVIQTSNELLADFRRKTHDVLLSPFKGNKKNGERRRRLDYATARAILETAHESLLAGV